MTLLVSACLLGVRCKYSGGSNETPAVLRLAQTHTLIPVCPECLGGLPTPRPPSERRGECVVTRDGTDVTAQFRRGAEETLRLAQLLGAEGAILKSRSPSCGSREIYDGSFTGRHIPGEGVTAALLRANGIRVLDETQLALL